jgi:hypothetical protein
MPHSNAMAFICKSRIHICNRRRDLMRMRLFERSARWRLALNVRTM